MSASFLSAVAIRSSDASSMEGFNEQRSSLTSLPHALVELLLSYLPYPMLGAVCSTNRLFRRLQVNAAQARSQRCLLHVPTVEPSEPWLLPYVFAEQLHRTPPATIAAAEMHSVLCLNGVLRSWGSGLHLGHGHEASVEVPTAIEALAEEHIVSVSAGLSHTVALSRSGAAWSWGFSTRGSLGHGDEFSGTYGHQPLPRRIASRTHVAQVACGEKHTLLLSRDGRVYSCGEGLGGQRGHGNANTERSP